MTLLNRNEEEFALVDFPDNHQKECLEQIGFQTLDNLKNKC
ncbi:hypothetical protein [Flavobacterium sp. 1]|nr:hypothetical protein [Flavobacterium sp. 1]